tara:strand:+ start:509 stop:868 length:360 start_codon:yes stop_codon:yes gene_type:complete
MKTNLEKEKYFNKLSEEFEFEIMDYFQIDELEEINEFEELAEKLQDESAFQIEIIYYSTAMEYLTRNDTSLTESLQLASDFGYEAKNLNSEILASILASENAMEEFYDKKNEIEEFFNN